MSCDEVETEFVEMCKDEEEDMQSEDEKLKEKKVLETFKGKQMKKRHKIFESPESLFLHRQQDQYS